MNINKNKRYNNSNHVKSEGGKIKDFIQQNKLNKKINNKASVLNSFTDLLYNSPSSFLLKFEEIKQALLKNEEYFDSMDNSLFYHYFIAIESAKTTQNNNDYDLLYKNILNFVDFFKEQLALKDTKGNTLLHYLAKNGQTEILEMILDHYRDKNVINLKEFNEKNENVLHIILGRCKKETFLRFYNKYSESYDLISLSKTPEFQIIIKMLTDYEKDLFHDLHNTLKDKNYDNFFEILNNFKNAELNSIIFYHNISFNYFMTFIEKNLDKHLQRLLDLINSKSPESIGYLFSENFNILLLALRRSKFLVIDLVFKYYLSHKHKCSPKTSLFNRRKVNVFHLVIHNQTLSLQDKLSVFFLLRDSLDHETYHSLINQPDHLGNYPLNYALVCLSGYNEIPNNYLGFVKFIANETDLEVFHQSLTKYEAGLVYKNVNFDKNPSEVKKKLIKNYVSHPSLCLAELNNPNHIIFMINFLKEMNLLNFFVLHKIYELSILDLILLRKFSQSELETTNLYEFIYNNIENFEKFSVHDGSYLYYCHVDSMVNLISRSSIKEPKVEPIVDLLTSLKRENFGQFLKFKIKKQMNLVRSNKSLIFTNQQTKSNTSEQVFTKNYIHKLKEKYLENLDSNYFVSLNTLVNNLDKLNSDSQTLLNDPNSIKESLKVEIKEINKKIQNGKKELINTSIISKKTGDKDYDYYRQKILLKLILSNDLIAILNNLNDFQTFSEIINCIISLSLPFKFYDLVGFLYKNLNPTQNGFLTKIIITSKDIFFQLYYNNPAFLFTHVYDLVRTVYSLDMKKYLNEFIQIVNHVKGFNVYLSCLFDLMIYNLLIKLLRNITKSKELLNNHCKNLFSHFKLLTETLEVHFPIKQIIGKDQPNVVQIFGIYNLFLYTKNFGERSVKFVQDTNCVFHIVNTLNYHELNRPSSFKEMNSSKLDLFVTNEKIRKIILESTNTQNQNRLVVFNNVLNQFYERLLDSLNYQMIKILSNEHYIAHLNLFWNLSDYYTEKIQKTNLFSRELQTIIDFVLRICSSLKKVSSREELDENEQVFLLKNFVYKFKLSVANSQTSTLLANFKRRLEMIKYSDTNNFRKLFQHIFFCDETYIICGKYFSLGDSLINKIIQVLFSTQEYIMFPYLNYHSFKQIFSNTYSMNSSIEYINPWKSLLNNYTLRSVEDTVNDINDYIEDTQTRSNVTFINPNEGKKIKKNFINFEVFDRNFRQIMPSIKLRELLLTNNKNYYLSSLSSILYNVFSQVKHNKFSVNLDLFNYYLEYFSENEIFIISDKNSSNLFLKITDLTKSIYDTISPVSQNLNKSDRLTELYMKILSNIVSELNNSDRKKLEEYETKVLSFTLSFALKLRSNDALRKYFNTIYSLKESLLKDLLFAKTFQLSTVLYTIFTDDWQNYRKIQQLSHKPYGITEYFNLKLDSVNKEIVLIRNDFCRMLKKLLHSNLYYFAIANNSTSLTNLFTQITSFQALKSSYLDKHLVEKKLVGLDKSVLISKNTSLLNEFKNIIQFNEDLYIFIAILYNMNEISLIDSLVSLNTFNLDLFILSCAFRKNNELFIHYFQNLDNQRMKALFDITLFGANLLHILVINNNYTLFNYLLNKFLNANSEIINTLSLRLYEDSSPLKLAIKSKSYEMYVLIEKYYTSEYKLNHLFNNYLFIENLIERLVNKKLDICDSLYNHNKSLFYYGHVSNLYLQYISKQSDFSKVVRYNRTSSKAKVPHEFPEEDISNLSNYESIQSVIDRFVKTNPSFDMNIPVLAFILTKPTEIGKIFFNLFDFQHVKNVRVILNFFCNVLHMNFDLDFYKSLLDYNGFVNEKFFFDLLYFNQKQGFKIFDVASYYESSNFVENYIPSDFKIESVLNQVQLLEFNSYVQPNGSFSQIYSDVKTLFNENAYRILAKAVHSKYQNLSNFIYMKVLNYSFDPQNIIALLDVNNTSLTVNEKNSLPFFIFNNFVLITQQLLSSKRYLFTDFNKVEHDNLHSLSILYQHFKINNEDLLLDQNSIYGLLMNDLFVGNLMNIVKNQKSFLCTKEASKQTVGSYQFVNTHFWTPITNIFQRFRNQIKDLVSLKDFQFFMNDQSDNLNYFIYKDDQLEDVFKFIFEEYQNSLGFYKHGNFIKKGGNTVKNCNLFDVNISGLSSYFIYYRNYQKITNRKSTQISTNNHGFNSYIERMSSFFEIILNISEICSEMACQLEIFYNRLYTEKIDPINSTKKLSLYQRTSNICYLISFENMIDNFKCEVVEQKKKKLVTEFVVAMEKAIKNNNYTLNLSIPFIMRTEDLTLIDSTLIISFNKSLSKYFSLYFDLLDSIVFNKNNLIIEFPEKLLYDNNQTVCVDNYDMKSFSFCSNFEQITDLKIRLLSKLFSTGKLSFEITEKPNEVTNLILDYLTNNSGIVSPESKLWKKGAPLRTINNYGPLVVSISDIFRNNASIITDVDNFINEIKNYQVYSTYRYFIDYIDFNLKAADQSNHLPPYIFTGFQTNVNNLFFSNNNFEVFLVDLVEKVSFLRELFLKYPKKQFEVNFESLFGIIERFVSNNQKGIGNNQMFNLRYIKSIFCSHSNSISVLIDHFLQTAPDNSSVLFNFENNRELNNPVNVGSQNNGLIDSLFIVNNINISQENDCFSVNFGIYSRNLELEVVPVFGNLENIFSKISTTSYNSELCKQYQMLSLLKLN